MSAPCLTIDPSRGFGRVCVAGRGLHAESVATAVWAEGGDVDGVAEDYGVSRDEALLCCWWWVTEGALDRGKDRARRTRWKRWADEQVVQILGGWRKGETLCNPDDYSARLAEELAARRVCCHACGARLLVGETAHDAEPADDGAERFACAEHCEVCR